jgi:hypothetical protein
MLFVLLKKKMSDPKRLKLVRAADCQTLQDSDWADIFFHAQPGAPGVSFKDIPRIYREDGQPFSVCTHFLRWLYGDQEVTRRHLPKMSLDHIYLRQEGDALHLFPLNCETLKPEHWADIKFMRSPDSADAARFGDMELIFDAETGLPLSVCEHYLQWLYGADAHAIGVNNIALVPSGDVLLLMPKPAPHLPLEAWDLISQLGRTHGVNTGRAADQGTNPLKLRQVGFQVEPIKDVCKYVRLDCRFGRDIKDVWENLVSRVGGLFRECGTLQSVELIGNTFEVMTSLMHVEHVTQFTAKIAELEFETVSELGQDSQRYLIELLTQRPNLRIIFNEFSLSPRDIFLPNPHRERVRISSLMNEQPLDAHSTLHQFCAHIDWAAV